MSSPGLNLGELISLVLVMGGEVEGSCRLGNILPVLPALESCSGDGLQWAAGYLQVPRILLPMSDLLMFSSELVWLSHVPLTA